LSLARWAVTSRMRCRESTQSGCRSGSKTEISPIRGLVAELAGRGLKIDYHSVWDFVHAEKLSFKRVAAGERDRPRGRAAASPVDTVSRSRRDWVQVGRVFSQEEELGADRTDELANCFAPVATELSMTTISPVRRIFADDGCFQARSFETSPIRQLKSNHLDWPAIRMIGVRYASESPLSILD